MAAPLGNGKRLSGAKVGRLLVCGLAVLVGAALLGTPASFAQTRGKKRPGRFKVGPLYLTPRLELKNAGVDTNVYQASSNAVQDTSVAFGPSLQAALPILERLRVTASGEAVYQYFRLRGTERSVDLRGEGRAEIDVASLTFFAGGGGLRAKQRFTIDLDQRVPRHEDWGSAGLRWGLTQRISTTLTGSRRAIRFGEVLIQGRDIRESLDRDDLTGGAQLRYSVSRKTTLLLSADTTGQTFVHQAFPGPGTSRSHRFLGGFEFGERAAINGKVLAGIREFPDAPSQAAPPYRGLALDIDASTRLPGSGRLLVQVDRDVRFASATVATENGIRRNAYVYARHGALVSFELPFDLIGRGFLRQEQGSYLLSAPDEPLRRDRLWSVGGSLLRRFGDRISIGATLSWFRRRSTLPGLSYGRKVYGLQAEVVP